MKKIILELLFINFVFCLFAQTGKDLKIGSYNIRHYYFGDNYDGNGWSNRFQPIVDSVFFKHGFDIIGTQECVKEQIEKLISDKYFNNKYAYIGRDRGHLTGTNEFCAIFYDKEKFEVKSYDTFWLSDLNTNIPNVAWDAVCERICTWGKFKEKESGFEFYFFNTHFDYKPLASINSVALLISKINEIAGNSPYIITGDFNFDHNSDGYKFFIGACNSLSDCYFCASENKTPEVTTSVNGWIPTNTRIIPAIIIDHIFVTRHFVVETYEIDTTIYKDNQNFRRCPSDHWAIVTQLNVK